MLDSAPRLLAVAHGTASVAGRATIDRLVDAVAAERPEVPVTLGFLDVLDPRLSDALDETPTVVVPVLLSTGYHVQTDVPAAVAAFPRTAVARHLGPHPLLVDVLTDRLGPLAGGGSVVLVGAGSSRSEAADELRATAALLEHRIGRPVRTLTMADDLRTALTPLPRPIQVATYLLAEGQFVTTLRRAAAGVASVADPLGVHPALVSLVWTRYDEAVAQVR